MIYRHILTTLFLLILIPLAVWAQALDLELEWIRLDNSTPMHYVSTIDNTIINVMYHGGTYISTDRGETWHDVSEEWYWGNSIYAITAFDGYLWTALSTNSMARSPDDGQTWQNLPFSQCDRTNDWAVLQGQLYVAGQRGVGRWSETLQTWEYPMDGLPIDNAEDSNDRPYVYSFAVRGGYLFAGLAAHGVYVFDAQSDYSGWHGICNFLR